MNTDETIRLLADKEFLDKLYRRIYRKCSGSHEAEDLCQDIILALLVGIREGREIGNFYAYAWTVADRKYADHLETLRRRSKHLLSTELDENIGGSEDPIETWIDSEEDAERIRLIFREIAFLSKIYREVTVLYYLDQLPIQEIAHRLQISESAVKQRLFSARKQLKKEVQKMEQNYPTLKPIKLYYIGTGNLPNDDPRIHAYRAFSKNLIYLCKDIPKTPEELAKSLGVPLLYVEEELDILSRGGNYTYGILKKVEGGKYITRVNVVDFEEFQTASGIYRKHAKEVAEALRDMLKDTEEEVNAFPFLSKFNDPKLLLWLMIHNTALILNRYTQEIMEEKYLSEISVNLHPFTMVAIACKETDQLNCISCYGCDGIWATDFCGYRSVGFTNLYGRQLRAHFHCDHNLSNDKQLAMTVRSIGGLDISLLSDEEQEIAAKAIEAGYICRTGDILEPQIVVMKYADRDAFEEILCKRSEAFEKVSAAIAEELAEHIRKKVRPDLLGEYKYYNDLIAATGLDDALVESFIENGLLNPHPAEGYGPEGVVLYVE